MNKKILVLYYTQTGQLGDIINSFLEPLKGNNCDVEVVRVYPQEEYVFPWTGKRFFSVMPDCVNGLAIALKPFEVKEKRYDLIVIGYQPWFLSPSLPTNALLQNPSVKELLKDTPVVTITGARNMWINALERIKKALKENHAKHVGNIALVDRTQNHISVITILYWMLGGKKDKLYGIFPKPGVSDTDIKNTAIYGELVKKHLEQNKWDSLQSELIEKKAVELNYNLMYTELTAVKIFKVWAKLLNGRKNKDAWLVVFKYYLLFALFIVAPVVLTFHNIFVRPFISTRIKKQTTYYLGVNYN